MRDVSSSVFRRGLLTPSSEASTVQDVLVALPRKTASLAGEWDPGQRLLIAAMPKGNDAIVLTRLAAGGRILRIMRSCLADFGP